MPDDGPRDADPGLDEATGGRYGWDPSAYDDRHSFVYEYGEELLDHLDSVDGDRVLDLGCGTGHLSARLASRGADVVGIDPSREMVTAASAAHDAPEFVRADARTVPFGEGFDAVLSNAVLHWIDRIDHEDVLASVSDVLRPGGLFVAELGGRGNVETVVDAVQRQAARRDHDIESPWYFPSIGEYAPRLEAHELAVEYAILFDRPTRLDGGEAGLREWLRMFGDSLLAPLPRPERARIVEATERELRPELLHDGVWTVDYRRLRFVARRG